MTAGQAQVAGFLEHLQKHGVQSRSIARKLSCLRGFYKWLLLDKRIGHDPTVNLESPASWKVLPKALALSEVERMMEQAGTAADHPQADAVALRDRAIVEMLYAGGIRVSELTGLGVEDLSLAEGRMLVRGKGDKERIVPLGRAAVEALDAYLSRGRPALAIRAGRAAFFYRFAAPDLPGSGCGAWSSNSMPAPAHTCCATVALRTWWRTEPI